MGHVRIHQIILSTAIIAVYLLPFVNIIDFLTNTTFNEFINEIDIPIPVSGYCSNTWGGGSDCHWVVKMLKIQQLIMYIIIPLYIIAIIWFPVLQFIKWCFCCNDNDNDNDNEEGRYLLDSLDYRHYEDTVLCIKDNGCICCPSLSLKVISILYWTICIVVAFGIIPVFLLNTVLPHITPHGIGIGMILHFVCPFLSIIHLCINLIIQSSINAANN